MILFILHIDTEHSIPSQGGVNDEPALAELLVPAVVLSLVD